MKTREEAVAYLVERGLDAKKRDWAMGETIMIFGDYKGTVNDIINTYGSLLYIAPAKSFDPALVPNQDGWVIVGNIKDKSYWADQEAYNTLAEACEAAVDLMK